MPTAEEYEALYGPPAAHSEHTVGDVIAYKDKRSLIGADSGIIVYVAAALEEKPMRYIVDPTGGKPLIEIPVQDVIHKRY